MSIQAWDGRAREIYGGVGKTYTVVSCRLLTAILVPWQSRDRDQHQHRKNKSKNVRILANAQVQGSPRSLADQLRRGPQNAGCENHHSCDTSEWVCTGVCTTRVWAGPAGHARKRARGC